MHFFILNEWKPDTCTKFECFFINTCEYQPPPYTKDLSKQLLCTISRLYSEKKTLSLITCARVVTEFLRR